MTSSVEGRFWKLFDTLPQDVQERARKKFALWQQSPHHPSLHFKKVGSEEPIWSVRITHEYRVLGMREGGHVEWFWIGSHDEYERILADL